MYFEAHADSTTTSSDGYKTQCRAQSIVSAGAEQGKAKLARRAQRKQEKDSRPEGDDGEDPDIAGIIPGPQPPRTDDY